MRYRGVLSRVAFLLLIARDFFVVIDACSSIAFRCFLPVCSSGYSRRRCELAIAYTFGTRLINRQGLYITDDPFYFNQRFAFQFRLGSMFDPTTCLQPLSNRYNHVPSQQTLYFYVTIARCSAPAYYACLGCYDVTLLLLGRDITLLLL